MCNLSTRHDWNFALGFAVLGMVHVTQYLAIVWKYNRGLTRREGAVRSGIFERLFSRGGWTVGSAFVLVCLLYGFFLIFPVSDRFTASDSVPMGAKWFIGVVFALGFTSTLLHYYYDGFIWKLRHRENQQSLGILPTESKVATQSWWDGVSRSTARGVFFRQCLYFVPPIVLLSATYWVLKDDSVRNAPIAHTLAAASSDEVGAAILAMEDQLEVERAMIQVRPRSKHYTYQADLLYLSSLARMTVTRQLGTTSDPLDENRRRSLAEAIASLERALEIGPPYGHPEDPTMSLEDVELRLAEWRIGLDEI